MRQSVTLTTQFLLVQVVNSCEFYFSKYVRSIERTRQFNFTSKGNVDLLSLANVVNVIPSVVSILSYFRTVILDIVIAGLMHWYFLQ